MKTANPPRSAICRRHRRLGVAVLPGGAALAQKQGGYEEHRPRLLLVFAPDENNKALLDQYARLQRDAGRSIPRTSMSSMSSAIAW